MIDDFPFKPPFIEDFPATFDYQRVSLKNAFSSHLSSSQRQPGFELLKTVVGKKPFPIPWIDIRLSYYLPIICH